jgi:hypothetical protein
MKMEQIECSETSAYIIETPGNYPKENIIYSEHGESLKSRTFRNILCIAYGVPFVAAISRGVCPI